MENDELLQDAVGLIGDDLILEGNETPKRKTNWLPKLVSAAACFAAYAANREIGLMERRNVLGMVFAKSGGSSTGAPRNFSAPKGWFCHSSIVRMPQQPFRREAYSSSGELPRGEMTPMPVITHLRLFIKTYNPPF